MHRLKI
jgi:hypothetical protein